MELISAISSKLTINSLDDCWNKWLRESATICKLSVRVMVNWGDVLQLKQKSMDSHLKTDAVFAQSLLLYFHGIAEISLRNMLGSALPNLHRFGLCLDLVLFNLSQLWRF